MKISLANYKTELPKELLKLAEKNAVRECDETEKGHYVAYVDEGEESYDVSVSVAKNGDIENAACDCNNSKKFCRHKTALLLFIAGQTKAKATRTVKVKASKSEALLDDAGLHELKSWVKNLLQKNPDIELAFVHHFSAGQQQFTTEEIEKITNDAVKAVVKNKKNIDPTQIKKIIELWEGMHAPIIKQYLPGAADENLFACFHALVNCCMDIQAQLQTTSRKISSYIESLLKQSAEPIAALYSDTAWGAATGYFIGQLTGSSTGVNLYYLQHLKNISSISSNERKKILLDAIVQHYAKAKSLNIHSSDVFTMQLFEMVQAEDMFQKYYGIFNPIEWKNEYNEKLIGQLINIKQYSIAEKYCLAQIASNYREEYNLIYWVLLKKIYTITNNNDALANVLANLFPYTFGFDDYLFISSRIQDEEERKKWRTKMLSKAGQLSRNGNPDAITFYFQLANEEKRYKKMIDYIDGYTPYGTILQYFEPMALTDKTQLLYKMLHKHEEWGWGLHLQTEEDTNTIFPALYQLMVKHYTESYLRAAVTKHINGLYSFSRPGKFVQYMMTELGVAK